MNRIVGNPSPASDPTALHPGFSCQPVDSTRCPPVLFLCILAVRQGVQTFQLHWGSAAVPCPWTRPRFRRWLIDQTACSHRAPVSPVFDRFGATLGWSWPSLESAWADVPVPDSNSVRSPVSVSPYLSWLSALVPCVFGWLPPCAMPPSTRPVFPWDELTDGGMPHATDPVLCCWAFPRSEPGRQSASPSGLAGHSAPR